LEDRSCAVIEVVNEWMRRRKRSRSNTPPGTGCGVQIRKEERPEKGLNLCIRSSKRPSFEIKEEESAP